MSRARSVTGGCSAASVGVNGGRRCGPKTFVLREITESGRHKKTTPKRASPGSSILLSPKPRSLARHWPKPIEGSPADARPDRCPCASPPERTSSATPSRTDRRPAGRGSAPGGARSPSPARPRPRPPPRLGPRAPGPAPGRPRSAPARGAAPRGSGAAGSGGAAAGPPVP